MNPEPGSESQSSNLLDGVPTSKTQQHFQPAIQTKEPAPKQWPSIKVNIQMMLIVVISITALSILAFIVTTLQHHGSLQLNSSQQQMQRAEGREQFPNWIGRKRKSIPTKSETLERQLRLIHLQRELLILRGQMPEQSDLPVRPISQLFQQEDSTKLNTWSEGSNSKQNKTNREETSPEAGVPVIPEGGSSVEKHEHFPRRVWMYVEEGIDFETNITRLMIANLAEYLKKHGYDFQMVGEYNWHFLMSNENEHSVGYVLFDLWHIAYETETTTNLKDHTFTIKKQLINLMMLSQMGGIVIDKQVLLLQDLSWLENFNKINLNNKGTCERPKVVGYYHINYTSSAEEVQISNYETKQLHLYPPLDPYFLAISREGVDFIKEVIAIYIDLLESPEKSRKMLAQLKLNMGEIKGHDPYFQSYFIAFASVLRKKQMQFDKEWQNSGYKKKRQLAIDHYGIFSLNRVYGPLKYRYIFSDQQDSAKYNFLSKLPSSQLESQFGKADYISFLPFPEKMEDLLIQAQEGNKSMLINRQSFFGKYLFSTVENSNWAIKGPLFATRQVKQGLLWKDLPRKVWIYSRQDSYLNRLCFESIRAAAIFSEFKAVELKDAHLMGHLTSSVIKKIEEAIRTIPEQMDRKSLLELRVKLVKIATLQSEGGVWMELPSFPIEDFEWLRKIHANADVLSKKRALPEVVMFYHPLKSGFPFDCTSSKCSLKNKLEILPYFIAAQPKARLISLWLKEALDNLELTQNQLSQKFGHYGISIRDSQGIKNYFQQTLLTVLRAQSAKIHNFADDSSAFDDFNVWLISSFSGPDKFKQYTNYDKGFNDNNTYLWGIPASKAKRMLGQFRYFVHLGETSSLFLNQKLVYHFFDLHINPNSFLSKYLINSQQQFDIKALQLLKDSKNTRNVLFPKIVWVYLSSLHEISEYQEKWLGNTIHHGSDYIVQVVSEESYHLFIEDDVEITELLREVIPKLETSEQVREDIIEQLILYSLLKSNGGLIVSSHCILAESLEWIHQVLDNPFRKQLNGKYVGNIAFYAKKISNKDDVGELQITESFRSYFLAASPNSNFIQELARSYILALHLLHKQVQYIPTLQQLNDEVFQLFYESSKARDRALSYETRMANIAKYYDIALLDSSLFGEKLSHYSQNQRISLLANMVLRQMSYYIGPVNYMLASMDKQELINIAKIKKPVKYSFVDMFINPEQQTQSQVNNTKVGVFNQSNFPLKVWFYKQMQDTAQLQQTKEVRLRLMCEQTDLSFMAIDNENIINHIDQATQGMIASSINRQNKLFHGKIKQMLFKLALLIKQGGILLSSNFIPIEGFDWIYHLPTQMQVQNRIKQSPTLIHFFDDQQINFSIDKRYDVRIVDSSTISLQFIAATKGNSFLKDLLSQALSLLSLDQKSLKDQVSMHSQVQKDEEYSAQFLLKIAYRQAVYKKAKSLNIQNLKVQGLRLKEFTVIPQQYKVLALPLQHGPMKIIHAIEDIGIYQIYSFLCHQQRVVLDQIYGSPRYFVKLIYKTFEGLEREGDEPCEIDSYFSIYLLKGKRSD